MSFVLCTRDRRFWLGKDGDGKPQFTCDYASRTRFTTIEAARSAHRELVDLMTGGLHVVEDTSVHSLPDGGRRA